MGTVIFKLISSGIELSKRFILVGRKHDLSVDRRLNRCKTVVELSVVRTACGYCHSFPVTENQQEPVLCCTVQKDIGLSAQE